MDLSAKTYKLLFLIPLSVLIQIGIIKCLNFVYEWGINYNLFVALISTLILSIVFSTLAGTFFIYYSRKEYTIPIYSVTPISLVCLYYSAFVYGFVWLTIVILLYPLIYLGGIKYYLTNDLGYQMYTQREKSFAIRREADEKRIRLAEQKLKERENS